MIFTHLLLRLASMPLTPTPPNVNLTLTMQWVGMDGFPKGENLSSRNTSLYKMQEFVIVTCSFWGEFELDLYHLSRFITNIINYVAGLAETKKCPQDLTFTKNCENKLSHVAEKGRKK